MIYCSAFSPSFPMVEAAQDEEIAKIIRAAIRNNRTLEVTGLLVVYRGGFIQALEGSAEALKTTYLRLQSDSRHRDLKIIRLAPIHVRQFPNWNMCARRLSETDDAILQALDIRGQFDPHILTSGSALTFLTAVREIQLNHSRKIT